MSLRTARTDLTVCRRKGTVEGFRILALDMVNRYNNGLWGGNEVPAEVKPGFGPPPAVAYVNQGRWVADCPTCRGSELVDPDENFFFCLSCFNRAIANRARRVTFPDFIREIDRVISVRPLRNQNWFPQETLEQLLTENMEHLG